MNGRERILATVRGERTDRLALMPITMMYAADVAGVTYREYASDHRVRAAAQLRVAERFGFDYVSVICDPACEASDLGATVEWFDNQPPAINESRALLQDKTTLTGLKIPDPHAPGRMHDRVEAVRLLSARAGADLAVEGWVEGPIAMAADLRGLNRLMLDFSDDEPFVEALCDFALQMELRFARAQIEAGATVVGIGDAAASLVGPKLYRRYGLPGERRLVEEIHALGAVARLHICGNTRRIIGGMGETGADIIDLDFLIPISEARVALGPKQVLLGNIDPVRELRDSTPERIEKALEECHRQAGPAWIVGAGCEIPRATPIENVEALARYAKHKP
jgi:MtaA/CmuA family methyltransferase